MTIPIPAVTAYVWVMSPLVDAAGVAQFVWSWNSWRIEPRLIATKSTRTIGAGGQAQFRLLRRKRFSPGGTNFITESSDMRAGCYVCITTAIDKSDLLGEVVERPRIGNVEWFGVITTLDEQFASDDGDSTGTATAVEVGTAILDQGRVYGFRQKVYGANFRQIDTPPVANTRDSSGALIGNAVLFSGSSEGTSYVFARESSECGSNPAEQGHLYWTPWRLMTHLATWCKPPGAPKIYIRLEDGSGVSSDNYQFGNSITKGSLAGWLESPTTPESYDLDGLTWSGALNLLAGAGAGLGWNLTLGKVGSEYAWVIVVFSRSSLAPQFGPPKNGVAGAPAFISYAANDSQTKDIQFSEDDANLYDEVVVQGSPIVFGVTVCNLDGNLDRAWTADQETLYVAASEKERAQPKFADVFSAFRLVRSSPGIGVRRSELPGEGGATQTLTPRIIWDDSRTAKVASGSPLQMTVNRIVTNATADFDQYLPSLRIATDVPFQNTVGPDSGISVGDAGGKATPTYMKPRVFCFANINAPWVDLMSRVASSSHTPISESPSFEVDDKRPGFHVAYSVPHVLGLDSFPVTADNGGSSPAYDWKKMVVTIGVPSDQRVECRRRRQFNGRYDLPDNAIRKSLVVRNVDYRCAVALAGTVVGVNKDNTKPIRVTADTFIANDFPAAQAYCDQLSAWAFRPKISATIECVLDGSVTATWRPGVLLSKITEGKTQKVVNGIIATVEADWQAGTTRITTELNPQPGGTGGTGGGQSPSPSAGGAVSVELGGTLAQVLQKTETRLAKVAARVATIPVIAPLGGGAAARTNIYVVESGQVVATVPGLLGIKWIGAMPYTIPEYLNLETYPTCVDGVGYVRSIDDGSLRLFLNAKPYSVGQGLIRGQRVMAFRTVTVQITGTPSLPDPAYRAQTFLVGAVIL